MKLVFSGTVLFLLHNQ